MEIREETDSRIKEAEGLDRLLQQIVREDKEADGAGAESGDEGEGEALTSAITEASYDESGDAWVNGEKYRRISDFSGEYRYFKWEQIKWRVLQNNGSTLFVIADKGLDCKKYNEENATVTWETCTLPSWLNNDFYGTAFSSSEQGAIVSQTIVNEGNDTTDKVFLLSISEAMNKDYGFCEHDSTRAWSVSRRLKASDYAKTRGVYVNDINSDAGNCTWWLRSTSNYSGWATVVYDGKVYNVGSTVDDNSGACVPALHISLSSNLWTMADEGTSINVFN